MKRRILIALIIVAAFSSSCSKDGVFLPPPATNLMLQDLNYLSGRHITDVLNYLNGRITSQKKTAEGTEVNLFKNAPEGTYTIFLRFNKDDRLVFYTSSRLNTMLGV